MMLFPLLLALVASALKNNRLLVWAAAAILAAICYGEPGVVIGWAQTNSFARWSVFLWPVVACLILLIANKERPDADTKQSA
jgi:peptidoglycan/LPS O-acetylase OafA/YrhL